MSGIHFENSNELIFPCFIILKPDMALRILNENFINLSNWDHGSLLVTLSEKSAYYTFSGINNRHSDTTVLNCSIFITTISMKKPKFCDKFNISFTSSTADS